MHWLLQNFVNVYNVVSNFLLSVVGQIRVSIFLSVQQLRSVSVPMLIYLVLQAIMP